MPKASAEKEKKRGRGQPAIGPLVNVNISPATMERVTAYANSEFISPRDAVRALVEIGLEHNNAPRIVTPAERLKEANAEMRELELAKARRETLTIDAVVDFYEKAMAVIRSRLNNVSQQVFGLTDDQAIELKQAISDACADIAGTEPETWDDVPTD